MSTALGKIRRMPKSNLTEKEKLIFIWRMIFSDEYDRMLACKACRVSREIKNWIVYRLKTKWVFGLRCAECNEKSNVKGFVPQHALPPAVKR